MPRALLVLTPFAFAAAMCAKKPAPAQAPAPAPAEAFTLVVTDAVLGNLEPCGCSRDQRGGVSRAAAAVAAIRKEGQPVVLVDGGDRFFPGAERPTDPLVANQQELQARAMAEATDAMRYDALVLGARDAGSAAFFAGTKLPPLLDTGANALPSTRPFVTMRVANHELGLFAVDGGDDDAKVLAARAASLKAQGADVLALFAYRTLDEAKQLLPAAKAAGVDFVFATRAGNPETHESGALSSLSPPLFTVASRGQELLRLDVAAGGAKGAPFVEIAGAGERAEELDAMKQRIDLLRGEVQDSNPLDPMTKLKTDKLLEVEGRRAKLAASAPPPLPAHRNAFTYAFVPMSPNLPQDPAVQAIVDRFHRDASQANLAYVRAHPQPCPRAKPGEASYVGNDSCEDCHDEAFAVWNKTPHAHAYLDLVKRGRQFDVACIGCHVLGYQQPGGACSIADVKGRENVQCESCHGPGSLHVDADGKGHIAKQVPAATCEKCHDPENSPHFNDRTYRPQVLGPGHGEPLAKADGKKHGGGRRE